MHTGDGGLLGPVMADLLEAAHRAGPRDVPGLVRRAGRRLGASHVWIYLADVQQETLVALPSPDAAGEALSGAPPVQETVDIDGSLAGRAYRTETLQVGSPPNHAGARSGPDASGPDAPAPTSDAVAWLPLVDGIGRIGVLRVAAPELDARLLADCRTLASAVALLIATKTQFSDVLVQTVRSRRMTLQAELLWAFVPPRTIGTSRVTSSAVLEPAYDIGGDAFDHNLAGPGLHLTLVDAMGHDLAAGGCSAVALAACRSTRRGGGTLPDIADTIEAAMARWIPDRLLTCVIADLDTVTGRLAWINCGHPAPLLIRDRHIVDRAFDRRPHLPLGLSAAFHAHRAEVHTAQLEPGDRILLYSDGVTEARDTDGELFGEQRLADTVVRAMADGLPAPEALRRLMLRILAHQDHRLRDDATILLTEWHPDG
ncbi:PP2C family protein-serine/threonine phosphatase [Kitasatospora sp. NPDC047058]|uniref:PP2C family protein-serine/threonine phosphatase n=1 Tax=Kitasatospora sp. NPDC047058 TaxID=3155620 RepID=UPI0033DD9872